MARNVYPVMGFLHAHETLRLLGRVGDDVEQGLVIPNIFFERRNVKVADEEAAGVSLGKRPRPFGHLFEIVHFVGEFFILLDVGNVSAGRHIEVVKFNIAAAALEIGGNVTGVFLAAEEKPALFAQRQLRENRNAVIGLLPVKGDVLVAHLANVLDREEVVAALDLLQA